MWKSETGALELLLSYYEHRKKMRGFEEKSYRDFLYDLILYYDNNLTASNPPSGAEVKARGHHEKRRTEARAASPSPPQDLRGDATEEEAATSKEGEKEKEKGEGQKDTVATDAKKEEGKEQTFEGKKDTAAMDEKEEKEQQSPETGKEDDGSRDKENRPECAADSHQLVRRQEEAENVREKDLNVAGPARDPASPAQPPQPRRATRGRIKCSSEGRRPANLREEESNISVDAALEKSLPLEIVTLEDSDEDEDGDDEMEEEEEEDEEEEEEEEDEEVADDSDDSCEVVGVSHDEERAAQHRAACAEPSAKRQRLMNDIRMDVKYRKFPSTAAKSSASSMPNSVPRVRDHSPRSGRFSVSTLSGIGGTRLPDAQAAISSSQLERSIDQLMSMSNFEQLTSLGARTLPQLSMGGGGSGGGGSFFCILCSSDFASERAYNHHQCFQMSVFRCTFCHKVLQSADRKAAHEARHLTQTRSSK